MVRINNYTFNMDAMTSFEGDTGPYLQYAHARLCSIARRAALPASTLISADLSVLTEAHAVNLARTIAQYPDVVQNTLKTHEPTTILTYLFKMTHALSSSYDVLRVVGSEEKVLAARSALYEAARIVLGNGMRVLGLSPVQRYGFCFAVEEEVCTGSVLMFPAGCERHPGCKELGDGLLLVMVSMNSCGKPFHHSYTYQRLAEELQWHELTQLVEDCPVNQAHLGSGCGPASTDEGLWSSSAEWPFI